MKYLLKFNESYGESLKVREAKDIINDFDSEPFSNNDLKFVDHIRKNSESFNLKVETCDIENGYLCLYPLKMEKVMERLLYIWKFKGFWILKDTNMVCYYQGSYQEGSETNKYKKYQVKDMADIFRH